MEAAAIVLAAGAGTRMKSKKPKVAHEVLGRPLVRWVVEAAKSAGASRVITVVGHEREQVIPLVEADTQVVVQEKRDGTAGAVLVCAEATKAMQRRINHAHMMAGVTMTDPDQVWIGPDVAIEADVELLPQTFLMGETTVGADSVIGPNSRLSDTKVGRGCVIEETVAIEAQLDDAATAGPRAYLRPGTHLCEGAKAGTHVEIKKSTIGAGSKVPHLSYIGDTTMGAGVNIGAGSITCNYDGKKKWPTVIGDDAFIGSDTMMVAPVTIGAGAIIGAASCITKEVQPDALALTRPEQVEIPGWAAKKRAKQAAGE